VIGGWRLRDARWRAEEMADDCDSWGKTTTRTHGLATRKESQNGAAERWLAGGEWAVAAYLGIGEKAMQGGGSFGHQGLL
jgi:hypothetical protein